MNLARLALFCDVVERGGFTAAADHLSLTQSAVSQYVKALEEQMGSSLLVREGRRVYPTEAGDVVYQAAKEIGRVWDEARLTVQELKGAEAGVGRVGASCPGDYLLPPLMARFTALHPKAHIVLTVDRPERIEAQVAQGELDFALVASLVAPVGLLCEPIRQEELLVVACPSHPFAERLTVDRQELVSEPFICAPDGSRMRQIVEGHLRESAIDGRRVTLELDSPESAKLAVLHGAGLAILFRSAVESELRAGILKQVHVGGLSMFHAIQLMCRPKRILSPFVRQLMDFFRREVG